MKERQTYIVEGVSKPLPKRYNICACQVKVTSERFLKMLGCSELELLYDEQTQSVEFRFLREENAKSQSEEGLAKLNRIANIQDYKSFMDIEEFVIKNLNNVHDFLEWQITKKTIRNK